MKPKLTHGLTALLIKKTGRSRYLINRVVKGEKIDPELREQIDGIIKDEMLRQQEFMAKLPREL